jgi:hypothetical protein
MSVAVAYAAFDARQVTVWVEFDLLSGRFQFGEEQYLNSRPAPHAGAHVSRYR